MIRAAVQPVFSRDAIDLEIKGDVLIGRMRSWAQHSAFYAPGEAITVRTGTRRNAGLLLKGLLAPIAVVIAAVFAYGILLLLARSGVPVPLHRLAEDLSLAMLGALAPAFLYTLWRVAEFLHPRPTLRVDVHNEDDVFTLEFWCRPGADPALDGLAARLREIAARAEEAVEVNAPSYAWEHRRPLRLMLVRSIRTTIGLYAITLLARMGVEWYYAHGFALTAPFYLVFALPWAWEMARYLAGAFLVSREPPDFRLALKHYHREEFELAEERFLEALRHNPDHVPSLYFLVNHYAKSLDFENAFRFCHRLFALAPEIAESLQDDLWALRRLATRMTA